jgi:hypothetical protein
VSSQIITSLVSFDLFYFILIYLFIFVLLFWGFKIPSVEKTHFVLVSVSTGSGSVVAY